MVWTKSDPRAINRTHRRTRTYKRDKCSMMSGLKLHCSQTTKENTMTIQIDRPHAAHTSFNSATAPTLPAAVWDLPEAESISRGARHVRTLSPVHRNSERVNAGTVRAGAQNSDMFETRHENRASLLMGAALGLALILGSAAGGAFAGDSSDQVADATSGVTAASVR